MEVRRENQINPVGDEVLALTSVVRPILTGLLYALKQQVVTESPVNNSQAIDLRV
jgi:hypothetical protein